MNEIPEKLSEYLASSSEPKQVLVKVKATQEPEPVAVGPDELLSAFDDAAETNRAEVVKTLLEEQSRDDRVQFHPIGMFNQVAVSAPSEVIEKIASRPDVDEVVPDAPADAFSEVDF